MCGITGKLNFNREPVTEIEIGQMNRALSHRGPNDEGVFVDGPIGLGHRRLAVIDLSPAGHQPMADAEGRLRITFNGEIYNFKEIKKSYEQRGHTFRTKTDTEIILHLYKIYGPDCLKYLRGMFAFAIWDSAKKELFIARDRAGQKPLKYYRDKNKFVFASELKAIIADKEIKKEPDWAAIDEFLTYKYVPAPKTGFKNIFKLPPAHYMIVKPDGSMDIKKYWDLDFAQKLELSEREWEEKIREKLIRAAGLRLVSDVPLGAHLSGGIDSGLITALLARELGKKVQTFSIGFEGGVSELPFARMIAEKYHTDHHEFTITPDAMAILPQLIFHYEEPYADASALPSWYLSEITKQHVTVALNGDGGDENFAGYERFTAALAYGKIGRVPLKKLWAGLSLKLYRLTGKKICADAYRLLNADFASTYDFYLSLIRYFSQREKDALYSSALKEKMNGSRWHEAAGQYFSETDGLNPLDQLLHTGIHTYLPDDLLVKVDIASMAHGLETRSPFLDHHLLELTARMPADLKIRKGNKKYILKKLAEKYLPRECIYRPKQGFTVPLNYWFRGKLSDYLRDNLLDKNFLGWGFNDNFIDKLIRDHRARKNNYENQLWTLLMLRLWLKQWFEQ